MFTVLISIILLGQAMAARDVSELFDKDVEYWKTEPDEPMKPSESRWRLKFDVPGCFGSFKGTATLRDFEWYELNPSLARFGPTMANLIEEHGVYQMFQINGTILAHPKYKADVIISWAGETKRAKLNGTASVYLNFGGQMVPRKRAFQLHGSSAQIALSSGDKNGRIHWGTNFNFEFETPVWSTESPEQAMFEAMKEDLDKSYDSRVKEIKRSMLAHFTVLDNLFMGLSNK